MEKNHIEISTEYCCPQTWHALSKVVVLWPFSQAWQINCCQCHLVPGCGTSFWNLQPFASRTWHSVTSPKSAAPSRSTGLLSPLQEALEICIQGFTLHVASPYQTQIPLTNSSVSFFFLKSLTTWKLCLFNRGCIISWILAENILNNLLQFLI